MRGAALGLALVAAGPAAAQGIECRLALVLALDVSSSVDTGENALQRGGLAAALVAPEVREAFFQTDLPVALAVFEWSGRWNQKRLLDWTLIERPGDLDTAASLIASSTRSTSEYPTAIGYAMGYASTVLREGPACLRQTVDVSGDGVNNEGFGPQAAYREFPFAEVTVNGLVIEEPDPEAQAEVSTAEYYEREVLHGPLAFLEVARGFEDYESAMRRKLEREVGSQAIGRLERGR
ncbi:DUF1194 domain-containing protein [Histidinibacterium aquaticum]|uniref:DUF1194 domain-containing protein n=1 Tax=Histidinibacterium aquaticum TaxID=2613962 RepID=A0A5J5GQM4_9RHOB|nr:DUF1194 domain-containing protein [Histidinibacterium aquaticum]KAA9009858.1 DUF1194 domain-containing protein [Histidinibacterium aquaticum]